MPAKTPRPIGRTDNFLPGSWKGSADSDAAAAEAAGSVEDALVLSGAVVPEAAVSWFAGGVVVGVVDEAAGEDAVVEPV